MALKMEMQTRQELRLVMTPQLQQAIKLLQLSRLELSEVLTQELEENPMLDLAEEDGDPMEDVAAVEAELGPIEIAAEDGDVPIDSSSAEAVTDVTDSKEEDVGDHGGVDDLEKMYGSSEYEDYLNENYDGDRSIREYGGETPNYENYIAGTESLSDNLAFQLRMTSNISDRELEIGSYLIGNITPEGYLESSVDEAITNLLPRLPDVTADEVEDVIWLLQTFEPAGIAASNLQDCLLIQARRRKDLHPLVVRILDEAFPKLEKQDYKGIARTLGVGQEQVFEAMRDLAELDPKPGLIFSADAIDYITPDIYVHKVGDEYHVVLNDDGMPKLRISQLYRNVMKNSKGVDSKEKEFLQEKMRAAAWLIKSIHQRQRTIYRVAESIVKMQQEFFDKGVSFMKPMILRDIAEDVGIHESTACRVCTNKYMYTPQGTFELRYFFNSSISRDNGDDLASESVKNRIKEMISAENPKKPFSDQALTESLESEGINIARRTVSKYREALGILSSSKRKKRF